MEASSSNSKNSAASKQAFPSPIELDVASSLLLLSTFTTIPPPRKKVELRKKSDEEKKKKKKKKMMMMELKLKLKGKAKENEEEKDEKKRSSLKFTISKSRLSSPASSTLTTENHSDQRAKFVAVVSKFPEMMKFEVVRKRRSKNFSISDCRKNCSSGKHEPSASGSGSSCLSSGSSGAISSGSNVINTKKQHGSYLFFAPAKRKPVLGSTHMRHRAEAILKILSSHGRASEVKIRELLGDSPSTSKALRILLNLEQVKRSGAGGRTDPYIYMIA